jgi:putative ABC transport system ATP-binding protein
MTRAIINMQNVKRDFTMGEETVHALRGIDLSIHQGEFVTIMGTSGSGKSTLLNILGCLDQPDSGIYELDGEQVKDLSRAQLAGIRNTKIGFIFQSYNLLARTSALENVALPLLYNPMISGPERRERAEHVLKQVGLESRMHHLPNQLSGGQQQRVAIARSLINEPVILLADEATGNLDTSTSYEVMHLFQQLNEKGITIGFVTHESDIARFSKRTIMLKDGHIVGDGLVEDRLMAIEELKSIPVSG